MTHVTQAERLTRIETLLETDLKNRESDRQAMQGKIKEIAADVKAIRVEMEADKAELAALKNKGAGILLGVGLAGGTVGAAVTGLLEWLK